MADHILRLEGTSEGPAVGSSDHDGECGEAAAAGLWPAGQLREYVAWARATFAPVVTPAARAVLQAYFQKQRAAASFDGRSGGDRATVRLLEGLVRLSQAHARLLARHRVTEQDAAAVLLLMDRCANTAAVLGGGGGELCSCELLDEEHAAAVRQLMERLGLQGRPGGGAKRGASVWDSDVEAGGPEEKLGVNWGDKLARVGPRQPKGTWAGLQRGAAAAASASHCKPATSMPPPPLPLRAPSAPAGGCTGAAVERGGDSQAGAVALPVSEAEVRQGAPGAAYSRAGGAEAARGPNSLAPGRAGSDAVALHGAKVREAVGVSSGNTRHASCGTARTAAVPGARGVEQCEDQGAVVRAGQAQHVASAPMSRRCNQVGAAGSGAVPRDVHALDLLQPRCTGQRGVGDRGCGMPLSEVSCNVRAVQGGAVVDQLRQARATSAPVFHFNTHEEEIDLSDIL